LHVLKIEPGAGSSSKSSQASGTPVLCSNQQHLSLSIAKKHDTRADPAERAAEIASISHLPKETTPTIGDKSPSRSTWKQFAVLESSIGTCWTSPSSRVHSAGLRCHRRRPTPKSPMPVISGDPSFRGLHNTTSSNHPRVLHKASHPCSLQAFLTNHFTKTLVRQQQ